MSKLDDLRLKVIEAEQNLVAEWPNHGHSICKKLQESRGREWMPMGLPNPSHDQWRFIDELRVAWSSLASAEIEALEIHRDAVLKNNQKVGS